MTLHPLLDLKFVKYTDPETGEEVRSQVRATDIDNSGLTGFKTTSTTELETAYGIQECTLDEDDDRMQPGMLIKLQADRDTWMYGVVMSKSTDSKPALVEFAVVKKSILYSKASEWTVSIEGGPLFGFSPNAVIGVSVDEITVPAIGQNMTAINILAERFVARNMTLLFTDVDDPGNCFRVLCTSYDKATGDFEGRCTETKGSGTATAWIVSLIPGPPSGATAAPTSVVKQAEATANASDTLTAPADIQEGDLLVFCDVAGVGVDLGDVTPDGFTVVKTSSGGFGEYSMITAVKIADGSEASATITGMNDGYKILHVFRPDVPVSAIAVSTPTGEFTTGNPSSQVIPGASGSGAVMVQVAAYFANGTGSRVNPRTFSTTKDGETNVLHDTAGKDSDLYLAWKIYNSAPVNSTIDMDDEGDYNILQGFYVELLGIEAEPGDTVVFEDDGSGGPLYPIGNGSQITNIITDANMRITRGSVSNASTMPVDIPAGYTYHELSFIAHPHTDATFLFMRTDTGGADVGDSGASDYSWAYATVQHDAAAPTMSVVADDLDAQIRFGPAASNVAAAAHFGTIQLHGLAQSTYQPHFTWNHSIRGSAATVPRRAVTGSGSRLATGVIDFVVLRFSGGSNITGEWVLRSYL